MKQNDLFDNAPKVTLIAHTPYAMDLLLFSKNTRLELSAAAFEEIQQMDMAEKLKEIAYMATTIPSSWEFVDVTFLFSNVSRACAQQITRTRTGSYAMQSMRVVDGSALGAINPYQPGTDLYKEMENAMTASRKAYDALVAGGSSREDARGILPLSTSCNLLAKYNLRSFVELVRSRSSLRTQGEYREIIQQAKASVLRIWPWARPFFNPKYALAIQLVEEIAKEAGIEPGHGIGWKMAKVADLIRQEG